MSALLKAIEPDKIMAKRTEVEQRRGLRTMLGAVTFGEMRRSHHEQQGVASELGCHSQNGIWGVKCRQCFKE